MTIEKPDYLYNPSLCPCPRGEKANCPRYKRCDACLTFHRTPGNPSQTACEKKAKLTVAREQLFFSFTP